MSIGPRTRFWITAIAWSLWCTPVYSLGSFEEMNSKAISLMRSGQTEEAERIWTEGLSSATLPEQKREIKNNLAVLYHRIGQDMRAQSIEDELSKAEGPGRSSENIGQSIGQRNLLAEQKPKKTAFTPLPLLTNNAANRIKVQIKDSVVKSLRGSGMQINDVSEGSVYKLPGDRKALITFNIRVTDPGNAVKNVLCYNITVQDQDGDIKVIDKQYAAGLPEMTDEYKSQVANEDMRNRAQQDEIAKKLDLIKRTGVELEAADSYARSQQDLAKGNAGYARYAHNMGYDK